MGLKSTIPQGVDFIENLDAFALVLNLDLTRIIEIDSMFLGVIS